MVRQTSAPALATALVHGHGRCRVGPSSGVRREVPQRDQAAARALEDRDAGRPEPPAPEPGPGPSAWSTARRPADRWSPRPVARQGDTTRRRRTRGPGRWPGPAHRRPGRRPSRAAPSRTAAGCRRRCPTRRAGWSGRSPGSSRSLSRSSVDADSGANGTASSSARSTTIARSAPESWTVAIPLEPGRTRRPAANSSSVSAISSRSPTRHTPYASNSASQAPSAPASAPECAATIAAPRPRRADGQRHHRHVGRRSPGQPRAEQLRRAHRLQQQRDDARLRLVQRVVQVVGRARDQLLPGGDREAEPDPPMAAQQGRERRPRVRHHRHRPGRQLLGLDVADRAQPPRHVDEAHAATAAHREAAFAGQSGHFGTPRHPGRGARTGGVADDAAVDHGRPVTALRGQRELGLQGDCRARRAGPGRPGRRSPAGSADRADRRSRRSAG